MPEALGFAVQMIVAGVVILGAAHFIRSHFGNTIPQSEIDAAARALIVEHGGDAEDIAQGHVERSQLAKGNIDTRERAERVLKAVRERVG